jgi:hypothetical protein
MTDIPDTHLQRLFAQEQLPAPNASLVSSVMAGVQRHRRNARAVSLLIALSVLLAAAALAPLVMTYLSHAFATLEVVTIEVASVRTPGFPFLTTALMALATIGAATWATRN